MSIYTPYTYLIGWSEHQKYYYGVRYAKKCNPKDLWSSYFTSSTHVKFFREEYGEPDVIQVRKVFTTKKQATEWETKVLKRMNVVRDDKWLNKNDRPALPVNTGHSEETKRKISKSTKGRVPGFIGKKHSQKTKQLMSQKAIGKPKSVEAKSKMSLRAKERFSKPENNPMFGRTHSSESLERIKGAALNRPLVISCIKCHKSGFHKGIQISHYHQHHKYC